MASSPRAFDFQMLTPQGVAARIAAVLVDVPAAEGRLSVQAGHQTAAVLLRAGPVVIVAPDGERETWRIEGGFLMVAAGRSAVLTRRAERGGTPHAS